MTHLARHGTHGRGGERASSINAHRLLRVGLWQRVYHQMLITAADTLYGRVLPLYEALSTPVKAIRVDNGRESSGRPRATPL